MWFCVFSLSFREPHSKTFCFYFLPSFRAPFLHVPRAIFRGKQRPGPGTYHTSARPRQGGGRFNESNPKSDMDWLVLREKAQPGPGFYDAPLAATSGGSLSRSSAKSDLEAAVQRAKALPGPGSHDPNHNLRFRSSGSGRFLTVYRPPHLQTTKASHAGDITSPVLSRRGNRSSL